MRGQFDGPRKLVGHDLVEQFSAHREICVPEVAFGTPVGEKHRESVGPADECPVGTGVADALGEAVPHRHVRPDHCLAVILRIVCHNRT